MNMNFLLVHCAWAVMLALYLKLAHTFRAARRQPCRFPVHGQTRPVSALSSNARSRGA